MEKNHATEKKQRLLAAVEAHFADLDEKDELPIITNACPSLADELGLPAAEVNTLLRMLHRQGKIGLVSGGLWVNIARTQDYLAVQRFIATGRRRRFKKTTSSPLPAAALAEAPAQPSETEKLEAEVDRLGLLVRGLQEKLEKSARHQSAAHSEREAARRAQQTAESELATARNTIRQLEAKVAASSATQARIDELEARLKEARAQNVITPEVATALAEYDAKRRQ